MSAELLEFCVKCIRCQKLVKDQDYFDFVLLAAQEALSFFANVSGKVHRNSNFCVLSFVCEGMTKRAASGPFGTFTVYQICDKTCRNDKTDVPQDGGLRQS